MHVRIHDSLPLLVVLFYALLPTSTLAQERSSVTDTESGAALTPTTTTIVYRTSTNTVAASAQTSNSSYTNLLLLKTTILNSTNFFRYEHAASYLAWNQSLADYAGTYASECQWAHSYGGPGENLARGYLDTTSAVDAWGDERALYNFSTSGPTGFTEPTGHFTQLVWQATQTVGCAAVDCGGRGGIDGWYLVCEYWPPGNIVGTGANETLYFEQNVSPQVNNGTSNATGTDTGGNYDVYSATVGATGVGTSWATGTLIPTATGTASGGTDGPKVFLHGHLPIHVFLLLSVGVIALCTAS